MKCYFNFTSYTLAGQTPEGERLTRSDRERATRNKWVSTTQGERGQAAVTERSKLRDEYKPGTQQQQARPRALPSAALDSTPWFTRVVSTST